jgi:hypothetical protein
MTWWLPGSRATGGICALCGSYLSTGELCGHHANVYNDDWSSSNKVWCDYFHRGIEIPRLSYIDRADDFWTNTADL